MKPELPSSHLPLDEALRRHAEGDRSPEVLRVLNHAAWDAFHAPWEAQPLENAMAESRPSSSFSEAAPDQVQDLSEAMLVRWAETEDYSCFRCPSRGILVDFRYSLKSHRRLTFQAWASGKDGNILVVQITSDCRVAPEDFVSALRLCNAWNQEYRWPRAMVEQDYRTVDAGKDPPPAPEEVDLREQTHPGRLVLDFQVPLSAGIHQYGLEAILNNMLETSWDFWRMAHEAWGL